LTLLCQKVMGNTGVVVGLDASPDMIRVAKSKVPPFQPAKPTFIEMNCADNDVVSKIRELGGPGFDFIFIKRFLGYLPNSPVIHGKLLHMLSQFLRPGGCFLVEMSDRLNRMPDRFAAKDFVTGEWVSFQVGDQKVVERFHVLPNNAAELTSKYIKHRVDLMNQAVPSCRPLKPKGIYTIFSKKVAEEAGHPAYHSRRTQWESQAREELQAKGSSPSQAEVDEFVANRLLSTYGPSLIDRCRQQRGQVVSWDSAPHMMVCRLSCD
jgi:SAM-dependent methyltransferase